MSNIIFSDMAKFNGTSQILQTVSQVLTTIKRGGGGVEIMTNACVLSTYSDISCANHVTIVCVESNVALSNYYTLWRLDPYIIYYS